ncbi:MAG: MBL fold metallo-hydrolase [Bacteroidota bacterium]|nr:MBL fold metallo-hydrolase [Bacteroidota bacterium]
MKIIPLSEGAFTVDKTKQFIPFNLQKDDLQQRNAGSLLVEIQPFVIVTSKDILLLDTGLGFTNANGSLQIHQNLIDNGINPSEVTKVLLSHLHKDHAGGISKVKNGERTLSFPHAVYYVNKQEFDFALANAKTSYIIEDFEILKNSSQAKFIEGGGILDEYISYEVTGAHSPFHQVFWVREDKEIVFFGGDVAPQLMQMRNKFIAKYDYNGRKSMELRQHWWKAGCQEKWTLLFYHDIKTPLFTAGNL